MSRISHLPALSNIAYMLSGILVILALGMLPSFVMAFFEYGNNWLVFGAVIASMLTVAWMLRVFNFKPSELTVRDGFFIVALSWIALASIGALPFCISGWIPSYTDAFFETMAGFTTTGSSILPDIERLPNSMLLWRSMTHWLGGMGVIALAVAIFPLMGTSGYQLFRAEVPGPVTEKLTPRIRTTARYLWYIYAAMTLVEFVLLVAGGMPPFDAVCTSFSTIATGGFSNRNASIAAYDSAYIQYVIIFFMFLAGVNFSLHFWALKGKVGNYFRDPEFRFYALLVLGATVFIILNRLTIEGAPFDEATIRGSLFSVLALITTTGFVSDNYELWPLASQIVLIGLMLIGGSTGSTSGGIKCVRIQISVKYIITEIRKLVHQSSIHIVRLGGKPVAESGIPNVIAFVLLFLFLYAAGILAMAALGFRLDEAIGGVAASLGNVGPGLGPIGGPVSNYSAASDPAKWLLSFYMLLGRLELWTVLVIFTRRFWRP